MQIPAIRISKAKGWRVAVADGNPDAHAKSMADVFECIDLKDGDGMLGFARELGDRGGIDGVFTAGTDFSSTVAWVSEKLGLPGISYRTALKATDKCLMRQTFAEVGVPSPRFACWNGEREPSAAASGIPFPVVVKPVDNMGARGVCRVTGPERLADACLRARSLSRSARVIIEEYMDGPELSLDAVVYRGEIMICGVADRIIRFAPNFVEMGHTMPTELTHDVRSQVEEVFRAGIRAIGIDMGAAKGDIKCTPKGPMVGEIAARLSGGYMSGWTYPFASGVEVTEAALNIALGIPPGDLIPRLSNISAERAFISIPGIVREVLGLEEARRGAEVREVFLRVAPGQEVAFPTNNVEKCGNAITSAATRETAVLSAEWAISRILIRLRPLNGETDRFLFGNNPEEDGLGAYRLMNEENKSAVAGMPFYGGNPAALDPGQALRFIPLPRPETESARDWHGFPLQEAVERITSSWDVASGTPSADFVLGRIFWLAFLRGSVQGVVYLLDSLREAARKGSAREYMSRICGS